MDFDGIVTSVLNGHHVLGAGPKAADSRGNRALDSIGVKLNFQVFDHSSFAFCGTEDENDPEKQQQQQQKFDTLMIKPRTGLDERNCLAFLDGSCGILHLR